MKVFTVFVGFTEVPTSQMVFVGVEAEFRCRHPTADVIAWRVNGTSLGQNPPPDILPDTDRVGDGSLVNTLTIIARLRYNGTEVECLAVFLEESPTETSPTALLQGTCIVIMLSINRSDVFCASNLFCKDLYTHTPNLPIL